MSAAYLTTAGQTESERLRVKIHIFYKRRPKTCWPRRCFIQSRLCNLAFSVKWRPLSEAPDRYLLSGVIISWSSLVQRVSMKVSGLLIFTFLTRRDFCRKSLIIMSMNIPACERYIFILACLLMNFAPRLITF